MSLVVNGTTVTKVIVVKDSVETNLTEIKANNKTVFKYFPVPSSTAWFMIYQDGKIVSYGDMPDLFDLIVQYSEEAESGIISNAAGIFLTKYVANNGHPYQTLRRTYVGNEETVPSFMTEDTYLEILSSENQAKFMHVYLPIDYYGPDVETLPFDREFIPVMAQALSRFGASPVYDPDGYLFMPPHYQEFPQGLSAMESALYSERENIFVFAESAEMAAFRHAHQDTNLIERFDIANSEIGFYLLFQAYGVEEETDPDEYQAALSYYFGESFLSGGDKFGDSKSFYTNTGLDSNVFSSCNNIVMDSINSWQEYFENRGIEYSTGNAFYDVWHEAMPYNNAYAGPWLAPSAAWPDSDKTITKSPILFLDKVPRGIRNVLKNYPVVLGPQAVGEALAVELIAEDSLKETGAKNNISNIKEIYETLEKDPISEDVLTPLDSTASATTFFDLNLYQTQETASGNELDPTTYFTVGVKE